MDWNNSTFLTSNCPICYFSFFTWFKINWYELSSRTVYHNAMQNWGSKIYASKESIRFIKLYPFNNYDYSLFFNYNILPVFARLYAPASSQHSPWLASSASLLELELRFFLPTIKAFLCLKSNPWDNMT